MQIISLGGILVGRVHDGDVEFLGVVSGRKSHVFDIPRDGDILASGRGDAAHDLFVARLEGRFRRS
jgi:hypothetical protein